MYVIHNADVLYLMIDLISIIIYPHSSWQSHSSLLEQHTTSVQHKHKYAILINKPHIYCLY